MAKITKLELRANRKRRIRVKVKGTAERPRLSVFKSAKHIYAQVIDDECGKTLASVGTFKLDKRAGIEISRQNGVKIASLCKDKKIEKVVFDKNGYAYHGRIKAFADGAREGGLIF